MPFAPGLASILAVDLAAADLALDGVEGQRLAVALDDAAHRLQFAAARQQAAQRLKRDPAAPALRQPGAERLGGIVSGGADRQRKGRRQRELVERRFRPRSFFSSPSVTATLPRSREPAMLLSRSSKVSLLPAS